MSPTLVKDPLSKNLLIRLEILQAGFMVVQWAEQLTASSVDEFYPRFIDALKAQPGKTCVVGDFSRTKTGNMQAALRGIEWLGQSRPYILRAAGCGTNVFIESMVKSVLILSGRNDIRMFRSRSEAEAWAFAGMTTRLSTPF